MYQFTLRMKETDSSWYVTMTTAFDRACFNVAKSFKNIIIILSETYGFDMTSF